MSLTRDDVMNALRTVEDPELMKDLVSLGMVKEAKVEGSSVFVNIELTTPACPLKAVIKKDVEAALHGIGATAVEIEFSARAQAEQGPRDLLPQVADIVAVGAGKGGVGKSTIAVNLAVALARAGHEVGLMDGDIYGPSIPTMLGLRGVRPRFENNRLIPLYAHGLHVITIGSLVDGEKPLIWRGPMAHSAFRQLIADQTNWPRLDYLIVDLPPGTGDVPLTLCQLMPLSGAVIVATPQQVALDDCIRAANMFATLNVRVLGIVENMSYFAAPDGTQHDIFGRGGVRRAAERLGLTYLGELPMFPELRINSDTGDPTANFNGNPALRQALETLAQNVAGQVRRHGGRAEGPALNVT